MEYLETIFILQLEQEHDMMGMGLRFDGTYVRLGLHIPYIYCILMDSSIGIMYRIYHIDLPSFGSRLRFHLHLSCF